MRKRLRQRKQAESLPWYLNKRNAMIRLLRLTARQESEEVKPKVLSLSLSLSLSLCISVEDITGADIGNAPTREGVGALTRAIGVFNHL